MSAVSDNHAVSLCAPLCCRHVASLGTGATFDRPIQDGRLILMFDWFQMRCMNVCMYALMYARMLGCCAYVYIFILFISYFRLLFTTFAGCFSCVSMSNITSTTFRNYPFGTNRGLCLMPIRTCISSSRYVPAILHDCLLRCAIFMFWKASQHFTSPSSFHSTVLLGS